jgi:hypothetical protein
VNCPICGDRIRITDPDDFALSRTPFVADVVDFCSEECANEYDGVEARDTLADLNPAACTLAAERAGEL